MSRRGKIEIISDILELCKTPTKKTAIVYQCNLNFKIVKGYLHSLLIKELLIREIIDGKHLYSTTDLGNTVQNTFRHSISLL